MTDYRNIHRFTLRIKKSHHRNFMWQYKAQASKKEYNILHGFRKVC